jgi:hypothetical protein
MLLVRSAPESKRVICNGVQDVQQKSECEIKEGAIVAALVRGEDAKQDADARYDGDEEAQPEKEVV